MRKAFSDALVKAALADERIVLLTGDHGYSLFDEFRKHCPKQYINAGIAEQNMVGVAAGLAKAGFRPIVYGLSAFVPIRVLEQIKLDVCYESLPVIFIGDGAGVVYSSLGSSHQSTEDIAVLRPLPDIAILSPADSHEITQCMRLAFDAKYPIYVRMGKADLGPVHEAATPMEWGKLCQVKTGYGKIAFIATGSMVRAALEVAKNWLDSPVWSVPFIKPLDTEKLVSLCQHYQALVVLEEHSIYGGLGSAVAEIAGTYAPTRVLRIGVQDRFSHYCGSYSYLLQEHQLSCEAIFNQVSEYLNNAP
ncbi:transketolase family protein [Anthocerotibacter panamensis]|uniref:transketolase family protein n=1 Tax=Anthocerotibacter panamensis TaxID=2857077 RepID=UPI001C401846|nr:transketolase C-terminal domain-containing protein [Anthocerotibacter panamensis]